MDAIAVPLIGIAGALIGVTVQHLLTRHTNKEGKLSDRVASAYSDYLNAASRLAYRHQMGDYEVVDKAVHQLTDAKCRIAVYGDARVIQAMKTFAHLGDKLDSKERIVAFLAIVLAMRRSGGANELISPDDLIPLLFPSIENMKEV